MKPTQNDTYRDRLKQHTTNKVPLNLKEYNNALKIFHRHKVHHTQFNKDRKPLGTIAAKLAEEKLTLP